jgi:hypothetical protein
MNIAVSAHDGARKRYIPFYLLRGRLHEYLPDEELNHLWTMTFKTMFLSQSPEDVQAHYDSRAELDLRGLELPVENVRDQLETRVNSKLKQDHFSTSPSSLKSDSHEIQAPLCGVI